VGRGGGSDSGGAAAPRPDPRAGNGPAELRGGVYGRRTAAAAALGEAAHITAAGSRQRLWRREGG